MTIKGILVFRVSSLYFVFYGHRLFCSTLAQEYSHRYHNTVKCFDLSTWTFGWPRQVSAILSSRPAILGVSGHDLLAKIEALTTLLGGTETELGAIIAQQPHLLLADVDDRLREKVLNACVRSRRVLR